MAFTEKLRIWCPIIKGLQAYGLGQYMNYLVSGILRKIQFRFDPELKELDNEILDDDVRMRVELVSFEIRGLICIIFTIFRWKQSGSII